MTNLGHPKNEMVSENIALFWDALDYLHTCLCLVVNVKICVAFFPIRLAAFVETLGTCLKVDKVVQMANMTSWKVLGYITMVLESRTTYLVK